MSDVKHFKLHPAHSDPEGDVLLVSNEGHHFKVKSYFLRAQSSVFRDMFSALGPNKPASSADAISVDETNLVLVLFLDYVTCKDTTQLKTYDVLVPTLKPAEKFDCPAVEAMCLLDLHKVAKDCAWNAFCLSSQYGFLILAKEALRHMNDDGHYTSQIWELSDMTEAKAGNCTVSYLLGFLQAVAKHGGSSHDTVVHGAYVMKYKYDWTSISNSFEPAV